VPLIVLAVTVLLSRPAFGAGGLVLSLAAAARIRFADGIFERPLSLTAAPRTRLSTSACRSLMVAQEC